MMKRVRLIAMLFLIAFGLVGCGMNAGIALEVSPNPIIFTSADNLIDATVSVRTTGFGELRIDSFYAIAMGIKDGVEVELFAINSDDLNFQPIQVPFAVGGISEEFQLQELLCEQFDQETFTVQDLIDLTPNEYEIISYDDLRTMESVTFKFTIQGSQTITEEVGFIFE